MITYTVYIYLIYALIILIYSGYNPIWWWLTSFFFSFSYKSKYKSKLRKYKQEVSIPSGGFCVWVYYTYVCMIMVLMILSVSVGKDRRRIRPGCCWNKSAGRSWGRYWSACVTMTPAACLASPASHTTTSTGRPLHSGHVRHTHTHCKKYCFTNCMQRMKCIWIWCIRQTVEVMGFPAHWKKPDLLKSDTKGSWPSVHMWRAMSENVLTVMICFQWGRFVRALVPITTPTGAWGPLMRHTTSCSVNLPLDFWSTLTSTRIRIRSVLILYIKTTWNHHGPCLLSL